MEKYPTISIIGGTVWGNRGAEAMLVTTVGRLRESFPDAKFHIFSYYPVKDRELVRDEKIQILSGKPISLVTHHFFGALISLLLQKIGLKIPRSKFFRVARALSKSDVLLDIGGITFSDGREKYLPFNILTIWPAMMLGVPVIKLAQAVGPFNHLPNRLMVKIFLFRCKHIFARGEKTADFLVEIGFPPDKFDTAADIAFLFKPEYSFSNENDEAVAQLIDRIDSASQQNKRIIVFSPSILVQAESQKRGLDYAVRLFSVIKKFGEKDFRYIFMPNATREGSEKAHNNDLIVIKQLKKLAGNGRLSGKLLKAIEWIDYDINTSSIRRIISGADVLVTSRYHAMISGLVLEIPTIVIGWGHKYKETMDYFGMSKYFMDFSDHEHDLADIVAAALDHKEQIKKMLRRKKESVWKLAGKQFIYLDKELA